MIKISLDELLIITFPKRAYLSLCFCYEWFYNWYQIRNRTFIVMINCHRSITSIEMKIGNGSLLSLLLQWMFYVHWLVHNIMITQIAQYVIIITHSRHQSLFLKAFFMHVCYYKNQKCLTPVIRPSFNYMYHVT